MNQSKNVKIVVTTPESHADMVREAVGTAGAGRLGRYSYCSISSNVIGRFKPDADADPAIGTVGMLESVEEERIEAICERESLQKVITAIKSVHPYEEVAVDIYALEDI